MKGLWLPWGKTRASWTPIGADFASARIEIPPQYRGPRPWTECVATWTLIVRRPNPRATFRGSGCGAVLDVQHEDLETAKAEAARRFYRAYGVKPPAEVDGRARTVLRDVARAFGVKSAAANHRPLPALVYVADGVAAATTGKLAYFARIDDVEDGAYVARANEVRPSPDGGEPHPTLYRLPDRPAVAGARFAMADVRAALAATDGELVELRSGEDGGAVGGVPMSGRRFGPAFCLKFRADLLRGALRFVGGEEATLSVTSTDATEATLRVDGPGRLAVFMAATERRP